MLSVAYAQDCPSVVLADSLQTTWDMEWLDEDQMIFSERNGTIKKLDVQSGKIDPLYSFRDVAQEIQSGLMGLSVHHSKDQTQTVFAVYSFYAADFSLMTRIVSLDYDPEQEKLNNEQVLLDSMPCGSSNLGGRIVSNDKYLWISIGDADRAAYAQDSKKLNGKILRIHHDGSIPDDNPILNSPIWSLGHRNPQGLVQTPFGLFASEHGSFVNDEINRIVAGENYGWPKTSGKDSSFHAAEWVWENTVAPSGIDYCENCLGDGKNYVLVAQLKGKQVEAIEVNDQGQLIKSHILVDERFGRIRDVLMSPAGDLYVCTSNLDVYSTIKQPDRIIKINGSCSD